MRKYLRSESKFSNFKIYKRVSRWIILSLEKKNVLIIFFGANYFFFFKYVSQVQSHTEIQCIKCE